MKTCKLILLLLVLANSIEVFSQVAINSTGVVPDGSSMLDVSSTSMGILIPRVALTASNAAGPVTLPQTSLLVYNTATASSGATYVYPGYYYNAGTTGAPNWVRVLSNKDAWNVIGNNGTVASAAGYGTAINNNFIGTTDAIDFTLATNNYERMRIKSDDANNLRIGMGTAFTVNLTGSGNPSILHLHDWGTSTNDYSQLNITTSSTNVGRTGVVNFAATSVTNERRTASIESYLTNYTAPNGSGDLRFFTNNVNSYTEKVRIQSNGYVGINNTVPNGFLEVSGRSVFNSGSSNLDGNNITFLNNSAKLLIGWNRSAGGGETNFITNRGAGLTGGFRFIDYTNSDVENVLVTMMGNGTVGIGTITPNASALLDITSTNKGILIPRIALTATNVAAPVTSPSDALLIYNTATAGVAPNNVVPGYYFWTTSSSKWNWLYSGTVPSIPGNVEYWIRPTAAFHIQPMYNSNAKVYDAGQTFAYYYDGNNSKGSFFAGGNVGLIAHRSGVPSTDAPGFTFDVFPFADAGADADITSVDNVSYTGLYSFGSAYMGSTGIGTLDAGVRGIGLADNTTGTNSSWPVVGVMGEVLYKGEWAGWDYGQQGVYGWQAAPAGTAPYCSGVLGRTSQTGYQSAGVAGYYNNNVGDLTTCFGATLFGLLGNASFGVYGNGSATTYGYLGSATQGAAGIYDANNYGIMGGPGYGAYGQSSGTNYGYLGHSAGYGVYGYNPGNWAGYFDGNTNIGNSTANLHRWWGVFRAGNTSDSHQILPNAGNWSYVGNATDYFYYMYSNNFIDPSKRELKRNIEPLNSDLYAMVMDDIDKIKPSFYKYNFETDLMEQGNEFKYRPNLHLGLIIDETPDYIQDNAFSGIDIYALSSLALAGVKYNHNDIEKLKTTISDFGSTSISGNEIWVNFSEEFSAQLNDNLLPVINITAYLSNNQLYISEKSKYGFKVRSEVSTNCSFDWIAMAKTEIENTVLPESNISKDLLLQIRVPENSKKRMQDFMRNYEENMGAVNSNEKKNKMNLELERPVPLAKMPEVKIDENAKSRIDKKKLEEERQNNQKNINK